MRLGRYQLTDELGEGGMASVFGADDTKLGRRVAIKVMFPHLARRPEAASRFKREARAAAGLDHVHILRVFDVGGGEVVDGDLIPPYIVLELIDGASLDEFFKERKLPMAEVVAAIGVALCRGLRVAHAQGIVHRDIKPANVMVTTSGRLVLADFGVARVGEEDSVVTRTGAILGTPAYMSPEQASSEEVDARSDLYSLGATLHRLASGTLPYAGTPAQVVSAILDGKRRPVEQLNPAMGRELSRVIDKLMERDPKDRFASAEELESALVEIVEDGGFADPEALVVDYVCDPEGAHSRIQQTVIRVSIIRAHKLAEAGRKPLALAIAERVLCLDETNLQARVLRDKLARSGGNRVWFAVLGPMVVTAFLGAVFWGSRPGPISTFADAGPAGATSLPTPFEDSPQSDGSVARDAGKSMRDAGVPESPNRNVPRKRAAPRKALRVDVTPPAPDAAPPPKAAPEPAPEDPASVIVNVGPWCDVWIDGKNVGRASASKRFALSAGAHDIECKQPGTGLRWQKHVKLAAGEKRTLSGTVLGEVRVRVQLTRGDTLRIANRVIANGDEVTLPADRYGVELLRKGKVVVKTRYLVLRKSCVLKDEPQLACFAR